MLPQETVSAQFKLFRFLFPSNGSKAIFGQPPISQYCRGCLTHYDVSQNNAVPLIGMLPAGKRKMCASVSDCFSRADEISAIFDVSLDSMTSDP